MFSFCQKGRKRFDKLKHDMTSAFVFRCHAGITYAKLTIAVGAEWITIQHFSRKNYSESILKLETIH